MELIQDLVKAAQLPDVMEGTGVLTPQIAAAPVTTTEGSAVDVVPVADGKLESQGAGCGSRESKGGQQGTLAPCVPDGCTPKSEGKVSELPATVGVAPGDAGEPISAPAPEIGVAPAATAAGSSVHTKATAPEPPWSRSRRGLALVDRAAGKTSTSGLAPGGIPGEAMDCSASETRLSARPHVPVPSLPIGPALVPDGGGAAAVGSTAASCGIAGGGIAGACAMSIGGGAGGADTVEEPSCYTLDAAMAATQGSSQSAVPAEALAPQLRQGGLIVLPEVGAGAADITGAAVDIAAGSAGAGTGGARLAQRKRQQQEDRDVGGVPAVASSDVPCGAAAPTIAELMSMPCPLPPMARAATGPLQCSYRYELGPGDDTELCFRNIRRRIEVELGDGCTLQMCLHLVR